SAVAKATLGLGATAGPATAAPNPIQIMGNVSKANLLAGFLPANVDYVGNGPDDGVGFVSNLDVGYLKSAVPTAGNFGNSNVIASVGAGSDGVYGTVDDTDFNDGAP